MCSIGNYIRSKAKIKYSEINTPRQTLEKNEKVKTEH